MKNVKKIELILFSLIINALISQTSLTFNITKMVKNDNLVFKDNVKTQLYINKDRTILTLTPQNNNPVIHKILLRKEEEIGGIPLIKYKIQNDNDIYLFVCSKMYTACNLTNEEDIDKGTYITYLTF